jgi:hypothetical protein
VRNARPDVIESQTAEVRRHQLGGVELAIAELRVLMQVVPQRDDARRQFLHRSIDALRLAEQRGGKQGE